MKCIPSYTGILTWNVDPTNISCVKDCMAYDIGKYQITKIGKSRNLVSVPGYKWQNTDGVEIDEVRCLIKEYGNEEYVGEEEARAQRRAITASAAVVARESPDVVNRHELGSKRDGWEHGAVRGEDGPEMPPRRMRPT